MKLFLIERIVKKPRGKYAKNIFGSFYHLFKDTLNHELKFMDSESHKIFKPRTLVVIIFVSDVNFHLRDIKR